MTKQCRKCGEVKDISIFSNDRSTKDGLDRWCRICQATRAREYKLKYPERYIAIKLRSKVRQREARKDNPRRFKNYDLRKFFGLDIDQYDQMVKHQEGRCLICKNIPTKSLVVDHNHNTGKIRGLLCHTCNMGLGLFRENVDYLTEAIAYVKNHSYLVAGQ